MKVAILGGGSCFAMNLASHLTIRGDDVLSISRSPLRPPPFTYGLEDSKTFRYEQAHLVAELPRIMMMLDRSRPDVIINFAALCEVGMSWNHALDYYETNLMSLVRLTDELAKRSWFRRFVQVGSSEIYGSVTAPVSEEYGAKPSSPYAVSKMAFDAHLVAIAKHQAFNATIILPSNGYCEGQTLNRIIPKTIIAAIKGEKIKLQGGGEAAKSYLHGDDISRAIMLVMEKGLIGETYNVGPLNPLRIREVVFFLANMMGKRFEDLVEMAPDRLGQDAVYWLDSTKIKTLGWEQKVSIPEGFGRMIEWVRKYPELLTMDQGYMHRP